jgi:hypothetical protein
MANSAAAAIASFGYACSTCFRDVLDGIFGVISSQKRSSALVWKGIELRLMALKMRLHAYVFGGT